MIKQVKVTNHRGETLTLDLKSPAQSGLFVRRIDGLGPSKSTINMGESLYEDGSYFNSARISARNIVFSLGFYNDSTFESVEIIRNKTYRFFPMKREIQFEFITDTRDVMAWGYVESNDPDIFSNNSGCVISVICPEAYLFDSNVVETKLTGVTGGFTFPFSNESLTEKLLTFGNVFITANAEVSYAGEVEVGLEFVLTFTGAANNVTIYNYSKDPDTTMAIDSAKITSLTGSNFINGDVLTISTVRGYKYATLKRGANTYNVIGAISSTADWFTIDKGVTVFGLLAQSGVSNIKYSIFHQVVYEGI
jgi:phage-related protein